VSKERDAVNELLDMLVVPPVTGEADAKAREYFRRSTAAAKTLKITRFATQGSLKEKTLFQRNLVHQRISDIQEIFYRAKATGLYLSIEPVHRLIKMSAGHTALKRIDEDPTFGQLLTDLVTLADLVQREESGERVINRMPVPQAESFSIFFNGIGGLPSNVIDANVLKRQQAFDKLSGLTFSKRRPRALFLCERKHDGKVSLVLGWRRMKDATGYMVRARDVFQDELEEFDAGPAAFSSLDPGVVDFYRRNVAPLFPSLTENDVALFEVDGVRENCLAAMSVRAYQKISSGKNDLFRAKVNRLSVTEKDLGAIGSEMARFAGSSLNDVTPYPFIADFLYGDSSLGWMLAGLNTVASFERGEGLESVTSYSYLGARFTTVSALIKAGKFFVPVDKDEAVKRFDSSVSNFGLARTLAEVLEKCGVLFFFDERENFDVSSLMFDTEAASLETSLLSTMIEAIDPSSSMVDPREIYAQVSRAVKQSAGGKLVVRDDSVEIPKLDSSDDSIDLLTFSGISRFLNVIVDASRRSS
jgi:hypothetical protein